MKLQQKKLPNIEKEPEGQNQIIYLDTQIFMINVESLHDVLYSKKLY